MFASLRRWTGGEMPDEEPPIALTVEALRVAGVDFGLLSARQGPLGTLISNDEVAACVTASTPAGCSPWPDSATRGRGLARAPRSRAAGATPSATAATTTR